MLMFGVVTEEMIPERRPFVPTFTTFTLLLYVTINNPLFVFFAFLYLGIKYVNNF
jgi:hypothetical protein